MEKWWKENKINRARDGEIQEASKFARGGEESKGLE